MSSVSSDDEGWDDPDSIDLWWDDPERACALLSQNDPETTKAKLVNEEHAMDICQALENNTVVEVLEVNVLWLPIPAGPVLNRCVVSCSALHEIDFATANGSGYLENAGAHFFRLTSSLLFAACVRRQIQTVGSFPLCPSTALDLCYFLSTNTCTQHLDVHFSRETNGTDMYTLQDLQNEVAPELARGISTTNLVALSLNWIEYDVFPEGVVLLEAFSRGSLPATVQQIEFSNMVDNVEITDAIVSLVQNAPPVATSFLFSFCKIEDDNHHRILDAVRARQVLKVLHYGFLHEGTAPGFAESLSNMDLQEVGVGFSDRANAFEAFCEALSPNHSILTLDIQLHLFEKGATDRYLRAIAIVLPKLPQLQKLKSTYLYHRCDVDYAPREFLVAMEAHRNLIKFTPKIRFTNSNDQRFVDYCLMRNLNRGKLEGSKCRVIETFAELHHDEIGTTLIHETLKARDDIWPQTSSMVQDNDTTNDPLPKIRRFNVGPIF